MRYAATARARQVLFDVVLPVASEQEPRLGITRFELHGALVSLTRIQAGVVGGERVANARIGTSATARMRRRREVWRARASWTGAEPFSGTLPKVAPGCNEVAK